MIFASYIFNDFYKISYFEIAVSLFLEWYDLFLYSYLINVILKMLLARYKYLNDLFKSTFSKNSDVIICNDGFLKRAEFILFTLKDAVDIFNEVFGWPLLFIIFYWSLLVLDYTDDYFKDVGSYSRIKLNAMSIGLLVVNLVRFGWFWCTVVN